MASLRRCQDIDPRVLRPIGTFRHCIFVSHRWEAKDTPDPEGKQLALLHRLFTEVENLAMGLTGFETPMVAQQGPVIAAHILFRTICSGEAGAEAKAAEYDLLEHIGVWYDFSCLPQAPRSAAEDDVFARAMQDLPGLLADPKVTTLILRWEGDDYRSRAWCFAEAAMAGRKEGTHWPFQLWAARWEAQVPGISGSGGFGQIIERTSLELVSGIGPVCEALSWPHRLTLDPCLPALAGILAKLETLPEGGDLDFAVETAALLGKLGLACREERDGIAIHLMLLNSMVADHSRGTVNVLREASERFAARRPLRLRRLNGQLEWQAPPTPPVESEWPIFVSYRRSTLTGEIAKWLKEELEREPLQALNEQWFHLKVFVDALEPVHGDFQSHLVPHLEHSRMLVLLADPGAATRRPQPKRDFLYEELSWWATYRSKTAPVILETDRTSARRLISGTPAFAHWTRTSWLECYWEEWRSGPEGRLEREQKRLLRVLRESIRIYGHDIHLAEVRRLRRTVHRLIAAVVAVFVAACLAGWLALALNRSLRESESRSYALSLSAAGGSIRSEDYAAARTALAEAPPALRSWEWGHLKVTADQAMLRLSGHSGGAKAVAFGPDNDSLLSIGADGYLRSWDTLTGRERWSTCPIQDRGAPPGDAAEQAILVREGFWTGPPGLSALAVSPDQKYAAAGNSQGHILVWEATNWKLAHNFKAHSQDVISLSFTEPNVLFSRGQEGAVKRWKLSTQHETEELINNSNQPGLMVLSPDRTRLALSHSKAIDTGTPTQVELFSFNADGGLRRLRKGTASPDIVAGMAYTDASYTLVAADFQGRLIFIGEDNSKPSFVDAVPADKIGYLPLGSVAASGSSAVLATGDKSGLIKLWDAKTRAPLRTLPGHSSDVRGLAFSSKGDRLASASLDGSVRIWDITIRGASTYHLVLEEDIWAFSPHPTDGSIVAAGDSGRLWLLNADGHVVTSSEEETDNSRTLLLHSPDGKSLLSVGNYGDWMLWDAATLRPMLSPEETRVETGCFTSEGRLVLLLEEGAVQVRNNDGHQPRTLVPSNEDDPVTAVAGLDNGTVAAVRKRGGLMILDVDGKTIQTTVLGLENITLLAVGPGGHIAAASDLSVGWWKRNGLGTWKQEHRITKAHEEPIRALAFSPDGRRLVTGSADQTCRIRDLATGLNLFETGPYGGIVHTLAFARDGNDLLVGSMESRISVLRGSSVNDLQQPEPVREP